MSTTKMLNSTELTIEMLTPVFVGGEKSDILSPYSDFIIKNDVVYILNSEKVVETLIAKNPALLEDYIKGIKGQFDNNRSNFDLSSFLHTHLGKDLSPFISRATQVMGRRETDKTEIARFISNAGNPYLPGSTLKGAIRSSILYYWLTKTSTGAIECDRILSSIKRAFIVENPYDFKREINKIDIESSLLGNIGDKKASLDSRFVRVSDSQPIPSEFLEIRNVSRKKIFDLTTVSPQWSEVLPTGLKIGFSITIEPKVAHQVLSELNTNGIEFVFKAINSFSQASIRYEIDRLGKNPDLKSRAVVFYNSLLSKIEKSGNEFAVMRTGRFKTYFDNSIGLALYEKDTETFDTFRKKMELGKNPSTKKVVQSGFPTTRSFTDPDLNPLGWVKISKGTPPGFGLEIKKQDYVTSVPPQAIAVVVPEPAVPVKPKDSVEAEVIDITVKPIRVKLIEGNFKDQTTILPGINPSGLGLEKGSKIYVRLELIKNKAIQKATFVQKV